MMDFDDIVRCRAACFREHRRDELRAACELFGPDHPRYAEWQATAFIADGLPCWTYNGCERAAPSNGAQSCM